MHTLPNLAPTNVAAIDERDPTSGNANHRYAIQYGGPDHLCLIQFQHGARGLPESIPGIFDDDLLAIVEDRLSGFQSGPFACAENELALNLIRGARQALGTRVARRISQGVLGINEQHKS